MRRWSSRCLSYLVAVPSAIKVFNWTATMYKGSISFETPMLYAFGFIGLFTIGGLTGCSWRPWRRRPRARHLFRHRALPLHHGRRMVMALSRRNALLVAEDDRPHVSGRLGASSSALLVFVGFNLTFFPQFMLGYLGMPRRYHAYPPEFQVLNVMSTAGASILAVGYLFPSFTCCGRCATAKIARRIPGMQWAWNGRLLRRRPRTILKRHPL